MGSKAAASASMKVHNFARGLWAATAASPEHEPATLSLAGRKRLRPLAPKLSSSPDSYSSTVSAAFDLKSFIRPESGPRNPESSSPDSDVKRDSPPVETHPGGTRWNPTQEQIGILEMLYRGGMRTPNAQQIEQITVQLRKYGKIEGKNVFYWFQNHKARERQKQKRNNLGLGQCQRAPTSPTTVISMITLSTTTNSREESATIRDDDSPYKRKCRSWGFEFLDEDQSKLLSCREYRTLELFPLHPEGR